MQRFYDIFPDIATQETRTLTLTLAGETQHDTIAFVDFYCIEPGCDCRRTVLQATRHRDGKVLATLGYAFEPPKPGDLAEDMGQLYLDPLGPQSPWSDDIHDLFETVALDEEFRERLIRHYEMVRTVADDPDHPMAGRIAEFNREAEGADMLKYLSWKARGETFRRSTSKVGRNEPCPCDSGKKYKSCCERRR